MKETKVGLFMDITNGGKAREKSDEKRKLDASLLLSETLEYCLALGVVPVVNGQEIRNPNGLEYRIEGEPNRLEMLDGLADVAYTMYWNAIAYDMPLEAAYERVCDNNLKKFVKVLMIPTYDVIDGRKLVHKANWDLGLDVTWDPSVVEVEIVQVDRNMFAIGSDSSGKVSKPSTYRKVKLEDLLDPHSVYENVKVNDQEKL